MKLLSFWRNMLSNVYCVSIWSRCMDRLFFNKNVWRSYRSLFRMLRKNRRNVTSYLTKCVSVIKKRRSNLSMWKLFASRKRVLKRWKFNVYSYRRVSFVYFVVLLVIRRSRRIRRWSLALISFDYWRWKTKLKSSVKKVRRYVGNWTL